MPYAKHEDNLTLLPVGQIEGDLDSGAGIQSGPHFAGKPGPAHCSRIPKGAVPPQELRPVAAHGPDRIVHVEKGNPAGELRVVGIPCEERSASGIDFGDHVHGRFRAQISQHPFYISRGRELTRPAGLISHFQHRELDRCVQGHVNPQL